ncbi:hypothetical protein [Solitalea lacus]|nr:hypothetical protein [Solitalea lacus]UKJ09343.1 hypothetical protein L2B55_04190 [Solitalea lacus]
MANKLNPKIRGWINYLWDNKPKKFESGVLLSASTSHKLGSEQVHSF